MDHFRFHCIRQNQKKNYEVRFFPIQIIGLKPEEATGKVTLEKLNMSIFLKSNKKAIKSDMNIYLTMGLVS